MDDLVQELEVWETVDNGLLRGGGFLLQWQSHPGFPARAQTPELRNLVEESAAAPSAGTWNQLEGMQKRAVKALWQKDSVANTLQVFAAAEGGELDPEQWLTIRKTIPAALVAWSEPLDLRTATTLARRGRCCLQLK